MKVAILDRQVRKNIALFKHLLQHQADRQERLSQIVEKQYEAYVNKDTGEIRFASLEKTPLSKDRWKMIVLELHPKDVEGPFDLIDEKKGFFNIEELNPEAYQVLTKTLQTLNQFFTHARKTKNPSWILGQIRGLDFELTEEEEGKMNLIQDAWYEINRHEAEELLLGQPIGTFLFRKDAFAQLLEEGLNRTQSVPILCISINYNDWDGKICERTIVYTGSDWLFYNDDPHLKGVNYPTLKALLSTLGDGLRRPLFCM